MKSYLKEYDLNSLSNLACFINELIPNGGIVLLKGDLAAGKTTLVKEFAKYKNIDEEISSPTFSVMNEYGGVIRHYDIYQNGVEGFLQSGLLETLVDEEKYYFIEWADESFEKMLENMGFEYIKIDIKAKENKRIYEVSTNAHS